MAKSEEKEIFSNHYKLSVIGIVLGFVMVVGGFVLLLLGFAGEMEVMMEADGFTAKLTNASPGIVLALFGMWVFVMYKPKAESKKTVTKKSHTKHSMGKSEIEKDDEWEVEITETTLKAFAHAKDITESLPLRRAIGKIIKIRDARIQAILGEELNKSPESEFGDLELAAITKFSAEGKGLEDISDLTNLPNLEFLNLPNNQITDISPIAGMKNLKLLSLNGNPLGKQPEALGPIRSVGNLDFLFLGACGLTTDSLAQLKGVKINKQLSIVYNSIKRMDVLYEYDILQDGSVLSADMNPLEASSISLLLATLSSRGVTVDISCVKNQDDKN